MKILVDEQLPRRLAKALDGLLAPEHRVHHARDYFDRGGVKDLEWIPRLSAEGGWIVISGDRRIAKSPNTAAAFRQSTIIGFFLSPGLYKAPLMKQAERLIALWQSIEATSGAVAGGAMFELPMTSTRLRQIR